MAEGDGALYNEFKARMPEGYYNLASGGDDIKVMLVGAGYTPDIDAHVVKVEITDECVGTGYTAGGKLLTGQNIVKDGTLDRAIFDADDVIWTGLGPLSPQPAFAVVYDDTHASKPLIAYWELTTLTNGGDYTLQMASSPDAIIILT